MVLPATSAWDGGNPPGNPPPTSAPHRPSTRSPLLHAVGETRAQLGVASPLLMLELPGEKQDDSDPAEQKDRRVCSATRLSASRSSLSRLPR
eukprot:5136853-Prymnesium_polylepis.1